MYKGFFVEKTDILHGLQIPENYLSYLNGKSLFVNQKDNIETSLKKAISKDGSIDASKLEDDWFPQIDADVFISHSHEDEKLAFAIAGLLFSKGVISFIDSAVWRYSNKLLKEIDDIYCFNNYNGSYIYEERNKSTSHVHMLLSSALAKMIDKTECLIFLSTPNSIKTSDIFEGKTQTESPWIYNELLISSIVRKNPPQFHRNILHKSGSDYEMSEKYSLTMNHPVISNHLNKINLLDLLNLVSDDDITSKFEFLDKLYEKY